MASLNKKYVTISTICNEWLLKNFWWKFVRKFKKAKNKQSFQEVDIWLVQNESHQMTYLNMGVC